MTGSTLTRHPVRPPRRVPLIPALWALAWLAIPGGPSWAAEASAQEGAGAAAASALEPIVCEAAAVPGAFSADGLHFLVVLSEDPTSMHLAALPVAGGPRVVIDIPLMSAGGALKGLRPIAAAADLSRVLLSAPRTGTLWWWEKRSGAVTPLPRLAGVEATAEMRVVPGCARDGSRVAVVADRHALVTVSLADASAPARLFAGGRGDDLDDVFWDGDGLLWDGNGCMAAIPLVGDAARWPVELPPDTAPTATRERAKLLGPATGAQRFWFCRGADLLRFDPRSGSCEVVERLGAGDPRWRRPDDGSLIGMTATLPDDDQDAAVTLRRLDAEGRAAGAAVTVPLGELERRLRAAARAELAAPRAGFSHGREGGRAQLLGATAHTAAVMVHRSVRYGFIGTEYADVAIVDLAAGTLASHAELALKWTSSGVASQVIDYPLVQESAAGTAVAVQLRGQVAVYALR